MRVSVRYSLCGARLAKGQLVLRQPSPGVIMYLVRYEGMLKS
jgi:hypothetical protein